MFCFLHLHFMQLFFPDPSILKKNAVQLMYNDFGKKLPRQFFKLATTYKEPAKPMIFHKNLLSKFGKESESACLDIESGPS